MKGLWRNVSIITSMFYVHWDEVLHCLFSRRALLQLGEALGQLPKGYSIWEAHRSNVVTKLC